MQLLCVCEYTHPYHAALWKEGRICLRSQLETHEHDTRTRHARRGHDELRLRFHHRRDAFDHRPRGKLTHFTYDLLYRKLTQTDPLTHTTEWTYDNEGNVLTTKRADNSVLSATYDAMGRKLTETNAKSETTTYAYHPDGTLASLTDARNSAYTFDTDAMSRRVKMTYPDTSFESWAYDNHGNLETYTNRAGVSAYYGHDVCDRETSCYWSDSTRAVYHTYDAAGRLTRLEDTEAGLSYYSYDNANQLTGDYFAFAGSGLNRGVAYTYDVDGNRATMTNPDSSQLVQYAYTARNQVASITVGGAPPMASFTYDAAGNRLTKALENGTTASYAYDDASRLTTVTHANSGTNLAALSYGYNAINLRTSGEAGDTYDYDAADQLATVSYAAGGSGAYAYDGAGNRTTATVLGATTSYTANALNQYTAVSGSTAPAYDANGNITGFGGATFTHRAADSRLMGATKGADTVTFTRDAQGRVMTRTINGVKTYFVYDGWNLVAEFESEPNPVLKTTYIHGPHTDEMLAKIDTTGVVYYHENALGSMVALSDASGNAVERYTYDVYGQPTIKDASGSTIASTAHGNRFLFTGREWIKELGIYDYRNRMYSAELGRFLETDPIGFDAGDVNIYRYVKNTPINRVDPFGLKENDCEDCNGNPKKGPGIGQKCCANVDPMSSSQPNPYSPSDTYMGINAQDMFKNGGDGPWGNIVRGCLVCMLKHGAGMHEAHMFCYNNASQRTSASNTAVGFATAVGAAASSATDGAGAEL